MMKMNVKTLLKAEKTDLSSGFEKSRWMSSEPTSNCEMRPAVTMGPMPSSISEPSVEAKMTRRAVEMVLWPTVESHKAGSRT